MRLEELPEKVWLDYDKNGLPYWRPITEQPYEDSVLYIRDDIVQQIEKPPESEETEGLGD